MASARNQPCNDNKSKLSVKFHGMEAGVASAARSHGILVGSSSPWLEIVATAAASPAQSADGKPLWGSRVRGSCGLKILLKAFFASA